MGDGIFLNKYLNRTNVLQTYGCWVSVADLCHLWDHSYMIPLPP